LPFINYFDQLFGLVVSALDFPRDCPGGTQTSQIEPLRRARLVRRSILMRYKYRRFSEEDAQDLMEQKCM
jgi:hypothetical protein